MRKDTGDLRILSKTFFLTRKHRVALGNHLSAIERGACHGDPRLVEGLHQRFSALEASLLEEMIELASHLPSFHWLCSVKGIGVSLAAQLLSLIPPFEDVPTVSKFWRLSGYGLNREGQIDRPRKGQRLPYRKELKALLYVTGTSLLRTGSPFSQVYYESKRRYGAERPTWSKLRVHRASMRRMIKSFAAVWWEVGRVESGCPIAPIWAIAIGKHDERHWLRPWDFVPDYVYWWQNLPLEQVNQILERKGA